MVDGAYRDALAKLAQIQEDWEGAMITGCKVCKRGFGPAHIQSLQQVEEDRIVAMKRSLLDYAQHLLSNVPVIDTVERVRVADD